MAIVHWNPYSEIESVRRQFDRAFNDMVAPASNNIGQPALEMHEAEDYFVLKAQLPGLEAQDLDIHATREAVVIKGEYRQEQDQENNRLRYSEFRYGSFQRAIKLPVAIQNDKIQAEFNNGILTLTLPKVEAAVNRVVKVNLGTEEATNVESSTQANQGN